MSTPTTIGVKGSDCYTSTGSTLNDLYVRLNRGLTQAEIASAVDIILKQGGVQEKVDLFVLCFQTRDIRGGKGERDLFRHIWSALAVSEPEAAMATVGLIPEYGYWEDLNQLAHTLDTGGGVREAVVGHITKQLLTDKLLLEGGGGQPKLSLVGRHAPRECNAKATDKALAKELAGLLFPGDKEKHKKYRLLVSSLSKALKVPEIAMAAGAWVTLEPSTMPGRCLKTHIKGLLNQPVNVGRHGRRVVLEDPDRVACATKFSEHLGRAAAGTATVKGANVVFPHELVRKALELLDKRKRCSWQGGCHGMDCDQQDPHALCTNCHEQKMAAGLERAGLFQAEYDAIEAQWRSIVDPIKALGTLRRWWPMCDFSGSMSGDPMHVSMALGLIIAECNGTDTILTFDSTPTIHKFKATKFLDRVLEVRHLAQGLSTDFQAAYNLLLKYLLENATPADQWPTHLLVLTDMGFDAACRFGSGGSSYNRAVKTATHETHMQIIRRSFQKQAEAVFGDTAAPPPPLLVCWNLRTIGSNFQATEDQAGVLSVSGWNPSLIKLLATQGAEAFDSKSILRIVLDDPRYDLVRAAVSAKYL